MQRGQVQYSRGHKQGQAFALHVVYDVGQVFITWLTMMHIARRCHRRSSMMLSTMVKDVGANAICPDAQMIIDRTYAVALYRRFGGL